jgi:hypothetical protein
VWIDKNAPEAIVKSAGRTELQKTLDLGFTPPRIWIDSAGQTTTAAVDRDLGRPAAVRSLA